MYDPLEMGTGRGAAAAAVVLRGWERDCHTCFEGAQGEVKLCSQPICFPGRSGPRVPREHYLELGLGKAVSVGALRSRRP